MAKLTDINPLNQAPDGNDLVHIVDVSNPESDPAGTSFRITVANLVGGFIASLGIYFNKTTDTTDDITEGVAKFTTVAEATKLAGIQTGATQNSTDVALRDRANHSGQQNASTISDFNTATDARVAQHVALPNPHSQYQLRNEKDALNGYAGLDGAGKINPAQLPALASNDTFVVASQAEMLALTVEVGDLAVRTDINQTFILRVAGASTLANWTQFLTPTDVVTSVFGRQGAVTAENGDYTTDQVTEANNLYHTVARVRATLLDGINFAVSTAVVAGDSILAAIGKLQAQVTANNANDAVTNAKLANVPSATIKGRVTAATGDPEDLTGTQATTLLDVFTIVLKGLVPPSGGGTTNFLRADGVFAAPGGGTSKETKTFTFDGQGAVPGVGSIAYISLPYAATINSWTMLAFDAAGAPVVADCVLDLWKDTYANYPPLVADTITASAKPTITTANRATSTALTGWTTAIVAGDILAARIDSVSTATKIILSLEITL